MNALHLVHRMTCLARTLALALLLTSACDGGPVPMDGGLDAGRDGGPPGPPDGSVLCSTDAECQDSVMCTRDICGPGGYCLHVAQPELCDDGVFCNGIELCDLREGCAPGGRTTCNDNDVCTLDRCNEATRSCDRSPRDLDADGDADFFCAGGTDCDDMNPDRSGTRNEVCDDLIDNDCDGTVDEPECGRPPHDLCDDPLDISAGGSFTLDSDGAARDYDITCGFGDPDVVASFTLTEARSVPIEGAADFFLDMALFDEPCGAASAELECDSGSPAVIRRRSLEPGTYYVISQSFSGGEIVLRSAFTDPLPTIANDTCASPIDVSAGGTFRGSFVEVEDDVRTSCGAFGAPDLFYTFTTTEARDVQISAVADTGDAMSWALSSACGAAPDLRCTRLTPASGTIHELPAGTYFLTVEGPTTRAVDFDLDVVFSAPTPPLAGDTCADPIPLTLGTPYTGTLANREDDIAFSCGVPYREAVHRFVLTELSDVEIRIDAGGAANASLRRDCADAATQVACIEGNPVRRRLLAVPAGTYDLLVGTATGGGYTVNVIASASSVTDVSGNETCTSAYSIPAAGGVFHGTTVGLANDSSGSCGGGSAPDAAFGLVLTARSHVVASTEGSGFDTVVYVRQDSCTGTERLCNDDAIGLQSRVEGDLDPGTYYIVVDGFGGSGEYFLDVLVTPL